MFTEEKKSELQKNGYCKIEGVLTPEQVKDTRERLIKAKAESERRGGKTYKPHVDPNAKNVRVYNLLDLDPVFIELIQHPLAIEIARHLLTDDFIISNFTANIALPGSGSMNIHSDLALVSEEPWESPDSLNIIWCLDDVTGDNGGTLYMPGSHHFKTKAEVPEDIADQMIPFEAKAGSIVVMEGRLWHTSGANITKDKERALMFGYYSRSSIAPQWKFNLGLRDETKATLNPQMKKWLSLG